MRDTARTHAHKLRGNLDMATWLRVFTALGMLSGTLAAFGATLVGWLLSEKVFDLEYTLDPWVWVIGLAAGAIIVGGAGTYAARGVINHPPISTLRQG